jgi:hypothetical protein
MTTETTEPEYATETWRWMGERHAGDGTRNNCWQDAGGQTRWFAAKARTAGAAVGGYYTARVRHHDDGQGLTLNGLPVFDRAAEPGDAMADLWRAEDRATKARASARTRERAAAKANELDDALAPLLAICRKLRTHADQEALMMLVLRKMNGAW